MCLRQYKTVKYKLIFKCLYCNVLRCAGKATWIKIMVSKCFYRTLLQVCKWLKHNIEYPSVSTQLQPSADMKVSLH